MGLVKKSIKEVTIVIKCGIKCGIKCIHHVIVVYIQDDEAAGTSWFPTSCLSVCLSVLLSTIAQQSVACTKLFALSMLAGLADTSLSSFTPCRRQASCSRCRLRLDRRPYLPSRIKTPFH